MSLFRKAKSLAYENAVRFNLTSYKRPFQSVTPDWDESYASGEHDHYGFISERPRYGVLHSYLAAREAPVSVLDVGCGEGFFRRGVADERIARFVGIDPSAVAVEQANAKGWARSEFKVGLLPDASFGSFDIVVFNEMLYYVEDLDVLFAATLKVLAPDGWVITSMTRHPADFTIKRKLGDYFRLVDSATVRSNIVNSKWWLACHSNKIALHPAAGKVNDLRLRG